MGRRIMRNKDEILLEQAYGSMQTEEQGSDDFIQDTLAEFLDDIIRYFESNPEFITHQNPNAPVPDAPEEIERLLELYTSKLRGYDSSPY